MRKIRCTACGEEFTERDDIYCQECLQNAENAAYDEGLRDGYDEGLKDGYENGRKDGFDDALHEIDNMLEIPWRIRVDILERLRGYR